MNWLEMLNFEVWNFNIYVFHDEHKLMLFPIFEKKFK